ncbi:transketolase [Streptomyces spiroverticillatus]|uniref:Transketolase n=1 Tax=Streptomyces finlayi TaxID=67296 RepID=A0A918X4E2_9ACTN|nr:transketolase C-terminal domain-containing protein [Streptomyces finlayi]GHA31834.1 transketolase [Streptomyces spiroverticillatus]GHD10872.1 transketolase [Streptomyces finlayi]
MTTATDATKGQDTRSAREVYRDTIARLLPGDDRFVVLDSDTGLFNGVDFAAGEERYLNLGIAEHTLMGAAAGLAREGRVPVVTTMAAFASSRALEAVKLDIALGNLPVVIAATHAGVSAGHLGPTHHALEDLATLRVLPHMTVVVPGDPGQTEELLRQALALGGPVYLRLGRGPTPALPATSAPRIGKAQVLRRGTDVTVAACGPYPALAALEAAELLDHDGISATVLHVHTVKPLDTPALLDALDGQRSVITVEEHWGAGGFGSAVAEELSALRPVQVHRIAMPDAFVPVAGSQQQLLERGGVSARAIADRARRTLTDPQGGTS